MKEKFFGFYPPNEDEIKDIWENGLIAFDANTLLNLYRYSKETRKDFIDTITEYKDRIWLPFQAGYEFHSNRISVIKSQEEAYSEIGKKLDEHFSKIEKELKQYRRHPLISIEKINKEISTKFNKIKSDLVKQSEKHPEYLKNDAILPEITKLFKDKVGDNYSESELNEIYDEGEIRYDKKIPPGFSDIAEKKNKGKRKLYGDLIVWKQLIRKSKSSKEHHNLCY
ncbi:PIN-like domain-containing protein [uncultured Algibacter sp.]|uniref:PIN-like domain-containing protein n=1 Tax=uncultured Algibacter sp. TaxID=298659 RepID=UPI00261297AC|nr:PIN-like domain-containing protein [uncultured Algibacter sp.]